MTDQHYSFHNNINSIEKQGSHDSAEQTADYFIQYFPSAKNISVFVKRNLSHDLVFNATSKELQAKELHGKPFSLFPFVWEVEEELASCTDALDHYAISIPVVESKLQ